MFEITEEEFSKLETAPVIVTMLNGETYKGWLDSYVSEIEDEENGAYIILATDDCPCLGLPNRDIKNIKPLKS